MRIISLCVNLCTLTMILSSCHTQKQMESLTVGSTNIHHAFNSARLFDLCDTITICQFDTMGQPQKQTKIIRHQKQKDQITNKDTIHQGKVNRTHQTTTKDINQIHWQSYDAIISWSLLLTFILFIAILYRKLHL